MKTNNFAMKEWHLEHVEKVIIRYITGISPDASSFEKRNFKKYSTISNCAKQIEYDIKHGVTNKEVCMFLQAIRVDSSYSDIRSGEGAMERLDEIEGYFGKPELLPNSYPSYKF